MKYVHYCTSTGEISKFKLSACEACTFLSIIESEWNAPVFVGYNAKLSHPVKMREVAFCTGQV